MLMNKHNWQNQIQTLTCNGKTPELDFYFSFNGLKAYLEPTEQGTVSGVAIVGTQSRKSQLTGSARQQGFSKLQES